MANYGSLSKKQETYTIWMKSLVLNGKGCTVFDSKGQVVYRVDNYNTKSNPQLYLMDTKGKVIFTLLKKKYKLFGLWEGYRSSSHEEKIKMKKPTFEVRKMFKISKGESPCHVMMWLDDDDGHDDEKRKELPCLYKIESSWSNVYRKSICKIFDQFGALVAEVTRKESDRGVVLGDDVLTMVVEPNTDHSLVMGLIVVYGSINHKM